MKMKLGLRAVTCLCLPMPPFLKACLLVILSAQADSAHSSLDSHLPIKVKTQGQGGASSLGCPIILLPWREA